MSKKPVKYQALALIEFGGDNREIEFRITPDGSDIKASLSINGEAEFTFANRRGLKILKDFIDQWATE